MQMIELKTSELVGAALDWAVATAESEDIVIHTIGQYRYDKKGGIHCCKYGCTFGPRSITHEAPRYEPSEDWEQLGPLIEKYKLHLHCDEPSASFLQSGMRIGYTANTVLIAACRAIVAAKLGDTVSVPAALVEG